MMLEHLLSTFIDFVVTKFNFNLSPLWCIKYHHEIFFLIEVDGGQKHGINQLLQNLLLKDLFEV